MDDFAMDQEAIGTRIARARKFRGGLTQQELADVVPCSKSLIAQVERGHKPATPSLVAAVAKALHVDVTELTGQPYRGSTPKTDRLHAVISQLRHALVYWDIPPDLEGEIRPLETLDREVRKVTRLRNEARYVELGDLLPRLLLELTVTSHTTDGGDREKAFKALALAYSAVDSMAYKLGYLDLFHLAVERMRWAAVRSGDPLMSSVADTRYSMAFLAEAAYDGGLRLLRRSAARLESEVASADRRVLAVYGTVRLRAAVLAARGHLRTETNEHLGAAREIADRLGVDIHDFGLLFGPTNTSIHEVATAVELGDPDEAIRRGAELRLPSSVPAERSSHHFIDMGRAYLWTGKREKALEAVLTAERIAPQRTRYHPFARETVTTLLDLQRRLPEPLRGIARRMGGFTNL